MLDSNEIVPIPAHPVRKSDPTLLAGKKVLITAGPTREYWDPVRFISNGSSGAMGAALAQEAQRLGARVTLVLGPVPRSPWMSANGSSKVLEEMKIIRVVSAEEMAEAVRKQLPGTQIFVGAAAVSDYRPLQPAKRKIKDRDENVVLKLARNPDIIAQVARRGPRRPSVVIGFALETNDLMKNARQKLQSKGLDWIVANRATNIGKAQGAAKMLSRWGEEITLGRMPKQKLAARIWDALLSRPAL
ncbi:MAG TPA: phosphopantothenoylcysteine decarboxylase [Elusimicrobiota bacterium]|nr:phosphopantothenoylcysteine decarboxylase [Elusimicrobiota bacterium]